MILFGSDIGFDPRIMLTLSSSSPSTYDQGKLQAASLSKGFSGGASSRKSSRVSSELLQSSSADRDGGGDAVDFFG
jgi:hypothetical protein